MAQTFHTIQGSEMMKDSRPKLNENFETLRSGFEGASEPANPVKGQRAFVGNVWKTYNGSAWVTDDALHNHDTRYYTQSQANTLLAGKANTSHTHDERYYTETETNTLLAGKSDTSHTHDARYYTESEIDTLLAGKSSTSHTHTYAIGNLSDVTIATPGSGQIIGHDGTGWKNRTLADAGISPVGHGHSYEAPLGNPDVDGKVLVSTAAGVRSWANVPIDVAKSLGSSGYVQLVNGLILQWGSLGTGSAGDKVATFPVTFPNACLQAVAVNLSNQSTYQNLSVTTMSTTSITIAQQSSFNGARWIAIGY